MVWGQAYWQAYSRGPFHSRSGLLVLGQCTLLLGMFHNLLLDVQSLASTDGVHVAQGSILGVRLLAVVSVLLLGGGCPEWIHIDHLQHSEWKQHEYNNNSSNDQTTSASGNPSSVHGKLEPEWRAHKSRQGRIDWPLINDHCTGNHV